MLREAIGKQRMAARKAGDLDGAQKYKAMLDALENKGQLPADDKMLKKQVEAAEAAFKIAAGELEKAYKGVVAKLVKDTTLDETVAESVESELKALGQKTRPDNPNKNSQIPKDAIKIGKHSYYIFLDRATQAESVVACRKRGGYLARITEPTEFAEIKRRLLPLHKALSFWVDGTDSASEGVWTFLDGESLSLGKPPNFKAMPWIPGQPDNRWGRQHGLTVMLHKSNDEWVVGFDDDFLDAFNYFICEWDEVQ